MAANPSSLAPFDAPDTAERTRLAKMCIRLLERWQLTRVQQSVMLGLSTGTRSTLRNFANGRPLPNQRDILDRAGHLMGIAKSLALLYPDNPELIDAWATRPDAALGGYTPYEIVERDGLAGLRDVRTYLDFCRGQ